MHYPFTAIVSQEEIKLALLLNAINPLIGGVLIQGEKGTAKSTTVRALAQLLPALDVVADCPYACATDDPDVMCAGCRRRREQGETLPVVQRQMRVVELPLNASEDRVVGALSLERALLDGQRHFAPGLLADANRGILYVDEVNLLDDHIVDLLLDAAAMGVNRVEREGLSYTHPSRFILVGTMNPEEGSLRPQLLDRFGLCAQVSRMVSSEERIAIMERQNAFERDPQGFCEAWRSQEEVLGASIVAARQRLPRVQVPREIRRSISFLVSQRLKADGHRGDLIIHYAARALAALEGRDVVTADDARRAAQLAMPHRAKVRHGESAGDLIASWNALNGSSPEEPAEIARMENLPEPEGQPDLEFKPGLAGVTRKIKGDDRALSLEAILRLPRDRRTRMMIGRRLKSPTRRRSGRYVRSRIHHPVTDLALDATLRAAAPYQRERGRANRGRLALRPDDLRQKVRERKSKALLVFTVDASDSVMSHRLMPAVKRALLALLLDAYQKRDRIAMVTFRYASAEVVLRPTANFSRARRCLEELWVGGPTPLARGLLEGLRLIQTERRRDPSLYPVLVLLSDGLPNVDLKGGMQRDDPVTDSLAVADLVRQEACRTVVIDSGPNFRSIGRAPGRSWPGSDEIGICRELAQRMGGAYWVLAGPEAASIVERGAAPCR